MIAQELDNARSELDVLRAREATALAEAKAMNAATVLALAQERASIAVLASVSLATKRKKAAYVDIAALSLEMILYARQQQGFHSKI